MNNFYNKSEKLLLSFLKEPWSLSFFPSSFFWRKENFDLNNIYSDFFNSEFYLKKDNNTKNLLYIHIPFCTKICSYCNCFKNKLEDRIDIFNYLSFLEKESKILFEINNNKKIIIDSIFIWGWTPNILNNKELIFLVEIIKKYFFIEKLDDFIIDWHPNHYNKWKLDILKKLWFTRVTFAVQSFDKKVLIQNNRDTYNEKSLKNNIDYARYIWLKVNIDLLIWLNWQTIETFENDIRTVNYMWYDNLSVHYFMDSNNIFYKLNSNFINLVNYSKKYFINNTIKNNYSNKFEDYFASTKNTTISIWASGVTNIYWKIIYSKPENKDYYNQLNFWILPINKWLEINYNDEMIKYIYLNILSWINVDNFYDIYWKNIFKSFAWEFNFLIKNKVISFKKWKIFSNFNDKDTLIYFNIFFIQKFSKIDLNLYNKIELNKFFLENWELIDK